MLKNFYKLKDFKSIVAVADSKKNLPKINKRDCFDK